MRSPFLLLLVLATSLALPVFARQVVPPAGMVYVPAGEFIMGSDDADDSEFNRRDNVPLRANDSRPQHKTTTGAFWIDKTEVTNAQYAKFCAATGVPAPPHWVDGVVPDGQADYPVYRVSWYEASGYARWAGKRLPSEAEWEKAARGTDGRRYPWGNDWDAGKAHTNGTEPREVGQFPNGASPYGALDMIGNVAEWTSSWWDAYPGAPTKQPEFGTRYKVVRGGAWAGTANVRQTWFRGVARPQTRIQWIGFRCVQDAPAPASVLP